MSDRTTPNDALTQALQQLKQHPGLQPSHIIPATPQPAAATVDHQIQHKSFWAALAGAVANAVVCAAIGYGAVLLAGAAIALTPFTMGASAALLVGAVAGGAAAFAIGNKIKDPVTDFVQNTFCKGERHGAIIEGASRTEIEGKAAARVGDPIACTRHSSPPVPIAEGSTNVFIENAPAAREKDKSKCSAPIVEGATRTFIGGGQKTYMKLDPEFTVWQRGLLFAVDFLIPPSGGLIKGFGRALFKPGAVKAALIGAVKTKPMRFITSAKNFYNNPNKWKEIGESFLKRKPDTPTPKGTAKPSGKCDDGVCNRPQKGEPIDPTTGEVIDQSVDIMLGQTLPLVIKRTHMTNADAPSLGHNWIGTLDQCLTLAYDGTDIFWHDDEGKAVHFAMPYHVSESVNTRHPGYVLSIVDDARTQFALLHTPSGITHYFQRIGDRARLVHIADQHDNEIQWQRDPQGRCHTILHSDGIHLDCHYDDTDYPERVTMISRRINDDDAHALVQYEFTRGYLTQSNSLAKGITQYHYNERGLLAGWNDAQHTWAKFEYDQHDRCVYSTCSDDYYEARFDYLDGKTRFTNGKGNVQDIYFDERGLLTKTVNPLGDSHTLEYNDHDQLIN